MAISRTVEQGVGEWCDWKDENGDKLLDHGEPVRVKVHALTREESRRASFAAYGNSKTGKLNAEKTVRSIDRGETHTRQAAILALEDTENFNVDLAGNEKAEKLFGAFPRTKAKHAKALDSEVCFDGQWTPEVKLAYFSGFSFSKRHAKIVADMANDVGTVAAIEEEQATADFSQP